VANLQGERPNKLHANVDSRAAGLRSLYLHHGRTHTIVPSAKLTRAFSVGLGTGTTTCDRAIEA
jgi:hypothetical protein